MPGDDDFERMIASLTLESLDQNLFRGFTPEPHLGRVFGGQVLAQSMNAACRTVDEDRRVHTMHAYFLRPGNPKRPIIYDVDPIRDGKRFTTRRVIARQNGKAIYSTSISFQVPEDGLDHQDPMPAVGDPESYPSDEERRNNDYARVNKEAFLPIEYRPTFDELDRSLTPRDQMFGVWVRPKGRLGDDVSLHQCVVAYLSDNYLMSTALRHHGKRWNDEDLQTASIDHALWFHGDFRADDWLYYDLSSPRSFGGRGVNFGRLYTRDGRMVATSAQEGLMRWTDND